MTVVGQWHQDATTNNIFHIISCSFHFRGEQTQSRVRFEWSSNHISFYFIQSVTSCLLQGTPITGKALNIILKRAFSQFNSQKMYRCIIYIANVVIEQKIYYYTYILYCNIYLIGSLPLMLYFNKFSFGDLLIGALVW